MKITAILLIILIALLAEGGISMYFLFKKTLKLEKGFTSFSRIIPHAPMRILVAGDSTAVGTGAMDSHNSTAGRLGTLYPEAEVVNLSENGLKIEGLLSKLQQQEKGGHFDIVLIQIGANDIIRLTSMKDIQEGVRLVLEEVAPLEGQVVLLHSGNIGEAEFFPWYLRSILSKRSLIVREIYRKEAAAYNASYVDLIGAPWATALREDPKRYYSKDFLHLNDEGYGLWFDEIKKVLK